MLSPSQRALSQITQPMKSNPFLYSGNSCTASAEAGAAHRPWACSRSGFPCWGRQRNGGAVVSAGSVASPCLVPTAAGTSARRVEVRGNFLMTESIWDVGACAKQTSLFLKFIPSPASGHKRAINIICISKFSGKHAHRQDAVCHNSMVQTGFKAAQMASLSSFFLVSLFANSLILSKKA